MKEYDKRRRIVRRLTTAIGLTSIVSAICGNTGKLIPCSMVLDEDMAAATLVWAFRRYWKSGVKEIVRMDLPGDEELELEHAIDCLKRDCKEVDKAL